MHIATALYGLQPMISATLTPISSCKTTRLFGLSAAQLINRSTIPHKIPIFRINLPSLNIYYNTHPLLCL